jgi:2-deoxy-scyllo-inosamine dehydrogenase (SAM-dependent)
MKKKFIDPLIKRKNSITKNIQYYKNNIPLPSVVEVSESGTCNRKCSFCPRSAPDFLDVKKFVSEDLINKLSKELSIYDYSGLFLFSGFVEPMVDKNIYFLILIVRNNLPKARIEMITNGDALNKQRVKKLFKSGLSTLLVSIYDGKKEAEEMEKLLQNSGLSEDQFKVRHRYLPENRSFGITLSNRAGMMDKAEYIIPSLKEPMKKPCYYPHYTFFMDYAGEVLICSHDWKKKLIVGNLNNETFIDIWLNQKFNLARKNLYNANRNFAPCNKCDVTGTFMGSIHAKAWNKI